MENLNTYSDDFNKFCIDSLKIIENVTFPSINMYNDYEAILVYFENSPHIEFILKNTILRLGKKWSFSVLCGCFNYHFMYSICCKISEE